MIQAEHYVPGKLSLKLTSADPDGAIWALTNKGVEIYDIRYINELSRQFRIRKDQYTLVKEVIRSRGDQISVTGRIGLYWLVKESPSRILLLAIAVLLLMLTLYLPERVLFVEVSGNEWIPKHRILEAAEVCGIRFGADRRLVRSERVKNALLEAVPQLQWAGVNTRGCVAAISVKERMEEEGKEEEGSFVKIVASRDGYILSGTASKGTTLFYPGQSVQQGALLISGFTDCGTHIRYDHPEGEIFAQTNRELDVLLPSFMEQRLSKKSQYKKISLLIRKKRIKIWEDSGILGDSCGRMYKEYYLTLPGGFQLPLGICLETYTEYETAPLEFSYEEAVHHLTDASQKYIQQQLIAGSILEKDEFVEEIRDGFLLKGNYVCVEMIGREQKEQIGETNGKID